MGAAQKPTKDKYYQRNLKLLMLLYDFRYMIPLSVAVL